MMGNRERLFKPACTEDVRTLCNRKHPYFLEQSVARHDCPWWVEKRENLERQYPGDIPMQLKQLDWHKDYVYNQAFQLSVDQLLHEVHVQTMVGALRPAVGGRLHTDPEVLWSRICG
jgi:hypothetical protein